MADDYQTLLGQYSAIEWLWLSGITHETGETAGAAWIKPVTVVTSASIGKPDLVSTATIATASAATNDDIDKLVSLQELNGFLQSWKEIGLAKTASSTVLGDGPLNPGIMIVTDMPDDFEDRSGQAFTSPFNEIIRNALQHAGYKPEEIYFTYLSKWRSPSRRPLNAQENVFCARVLEKEIGFVRPQAILSLGESVTRALQSSSTSGTHDKQAQKTYKNQYISINLPFMASQKGEVLVKNCLMKKSFWFGLIEFADATRSGSLFVRDATDVNNAEYISDV